MVCVAINISRGGSLRVSVQLHEYGVTKTMIYWLLLSGHASSHASHVSTVFNCFSIDAAPTKCFLHHIFRRCVLPPNCPFKHRFASLSLILSQYIFSIIFLFILWFAVCVSRTSCCLWVFFFFFAFSLFRYEIRTFT